MQKQAHTCARDPITGRHTGRHAGLLPRGLGQAARRSAMRVTQERGCFVPVPRKREACVWTAGVCVRLQGAIRLSGQLFCQAVASL